MSNKIRVGILFGGRSGEHEVSIASAMSVYKALDKSKYDVTLIGIDKTGRWLLPEVEMLLKHTDQPMNIQLNQVQGSFALIPHPAKDQIFPIQGTSTHVPPLDVIFPVLHGSFGEDGTMQGMLETAQIPYIGSGVLGSSLGMDKEVATKLFASAGITTIPAACVRKHEFLTDAKGLMERLLRDFSLPFFIKPANAGSSVGVHKIKSADQLRAALEDAFSFDLKILVQKAVAARELEVAVLGNESPQASIVGEIIPSHEFYSYEAKYLDENGAALKIPAEIPEEVALKARDWAIRAFKVLECRGLARVDFFLDRESGDLMINEINTIPGFTQISMYPKLWEASGIGYKDLLDELIRLALDQHRQRSALKTSK